MIKNKETVVGWVLIILLMLGYFFYQNKAYAEQEKAKKEQQALEQRNKPKSAGTTPASDTTAIGGTNASGKNNAVAAAETAAAETANDTSALKAKYGAFAGASKGEDKTFTIENDVQRITLTSKGGEIARIELKKFKTWDSLPLVMFTNKTNHLSYTLTTDGNSAVNTRDLYFEPVGDTFTVTGNQTKSFALRMNAGEGRYIEQKYTLSGNSYLFDYNVTMAGLNKVMPANTTFIYADWDNTLTALEHNIKRERSYSALYFKYNDNEVTHLSEDKEADSLDAAASLEWISYKQQFFNTTLFGKGLFQTPHLKTHYNKDDNSFVKEYSTRFTLPFSNKDSTTYAFQYYIGPNKYNDLAKLDRSVQSIIKLSPDFWLFSWIRYITRFIIWVFSWFNKVNLNYGIIILLMTIILKIVLHPLTARSIESSAKMKILAPELAALKEKYGDDQAKISQEQMKIYNRAGVSPFGGCLPLLIQMPILMAMYYFFPTSIELRQQHFLWATDLSSYDSIATFSTMLPLIGNHISLLTILMTITSVGQAVMNNQMNPMANQQPGMKYMPYFMPVMLMFMFNDFPAALTYYYMLQNLLGMAHQWIIQKFFIDDVKLRKQIEENKKNPKPQSGWAKKLADIQKQAQSQQQPKKK